MQSIPDDLKSALGPNEQVQSYIKQKIHHPKMNIDSVVIIDERIILRHPQAPRLKKDYTRLQLAGPFEHGPCQGVPPLHSEVHTKVRRRAA